MNHASSSSLRLARNETVGRPATSDEDLGHTVVSIPVMALRGGLSPRLEGEHKAHVARLAEAETPLPPILVDRRSMRVIDGMHRLLAASLRGQETIDAEFYDGSPEDAFLRAVKENATHGLPLSLADRRAAVARIVVSHPQMSDRAIGQLAGLAAAVVAAIRRSTGRLSEPTARIGKDGKVRPLNSAKGRRKAAALLAEHPDASLREIAREAGISPATVRDVRKRLEQGLEPVLVTRSSEARAEVTSSPDVQRGLALTVTLEKLQRDPSMRNNELGRGLLRAFQLNAVGTEEPSTVAAAVPPHCVPLVVHVARHYAQMWQKIAKELEDRLRVIEPFDAVR